MKSDIRVCADWESTHERPVYTLGEECPECGGQAVNSAPARFNPEDPHGEYRRRARRRRAAESEAPDRDADDAAADNPAAAEGDAGDGNV